MRLTEINLFGVYVAPMSSMMGCRLSGDDRTALVRCPFRPDAIRSSRATPSAPRCGSEGVDAEVLWRLPNRRAILRRPPFVSWRFQCRMAGSGASCPLPCVPAKVSSLNRQRPFSRCSGNGSSCLTPAVRGARRRGLNWVVERRRTIRNRSRYIPAARTVNTPGVVDFG